MGNRFSYCFHAKTEALNDRKYNYKILETGMGQFGAKMNFLCILQVSRFVFVLKIKLYTHFSIFNYLWTGRQILGKSGAYKFPETRSTVSLDCGF
jgi:hypothetical protein